MKKTKRLRVIYDPLNITCALVVRGGSLSQVHCAETGEYIPDRTLTPLIIVPQVYVNDPSGVLPSGFVSLNNVNWYALPQDIAAAVGNDAYLENELSAYLIMQGMAGYAVGTNGQLTVTANVPYLSPQALVFTGEYYDTRQRSSIRLHAQLTLTTTSIALPRTLELDKPASFVFDPLSDTGTRSIKATMRVGGKNAVEGTFEAGYWWYHMVDGVEVLISADDLFYEFGQNTDTLTIDPRYIDGQERIICKSECVMGDVVLPVNPTATALKAEVVAVRRYADYDFEHFVHGGTAVSNSTTIVKNECVVTVGRTVLNSPQEYFTIKWSIKRMIPGADWEEIGCGNMIDIEASEFENGADVALEIEELEPLGAMVDGTDIICDGNDVITL